MLDELLARKAERVARLPRDVREEAAEARGVLLLLLQPDVPVHRHEAAQLVRGHLLVTFLRAPVRALDAVEGDAAYLEHASDLGEHRVLLLEADVAEHVEAHDVVEARVGERQAREARRDTGVVAVAPRGERALLREVAAHERHALALQEGEHARAAAEVEHRRAHPHVVVDPHRPRKPDVEAVERAEVARVQDLVRHELRAVELRQVFYAGAAVQVVSHGN